LINHRTLPLLTIQAVIIMVALVSCRSKPEPSTATPDLAEHPAPTAETNAASEEEGEPPELVTIEVTRVIVENELVVVTPEPAEEEEEPKELVVCISEEPETLYPYGLRNTSTTATHVLQGVYEASFTNREFDYQARGLEKMPSLADDDAVLSVVLVDEGDVVVDSDGDVVTLREEVRVIDATGEEVSFEGTPLEMNQLVVSFSLKPMIWSDGTPITADDSVFSFELASDPHTPIPKNLIARTHSYEATGDLSLEWTGVPGFYDRSYFTNIWTPFPRHYWGEISAEELLEADVSTRRPLSSGPFVISEWIPGDQIVLVKNENYYLANEGLPLVDIVRFVFVPNSSQQIASLLSGQCDIATQDGISVSDIPSLLEAEENGLLTPYQQIGTVFEHVDFGINPVNEYMTERPDWFEDVRVRKAFTMCTDRQRMVDELLHSQSEVIHSYIPGTHPLYPEDATEWPYDPVAANELLDSAGFADIDEDGIRNDPRTGSKFKVKLLSSIGNEIAENVAFRIQDDLIRCGIEVVPEFLTNDEYYADGPEGPLFGRRFDLAAFPWLISTEPNCALYLSTRIPGEENAWNRSFNNQTGFVNEDFDAACSTALSILPGMPGYEENHQQAMRVWSEELPIIPLFMRVKVAASRPEVKNLNLDPTQPSELWNLYEIDIVDTDDSSSP
jgi:peptide/nickel transport system substrate-binding protein